MIGNRHYALKYFLMEFLSFVNVTIGFFVLCAVTEYYPPGLGEMLGVMRLIFADERECTFRRSTGTGDVEIQNFFW